jgi:hypothetical protein
MNEPTNPMAALYAALAKAQGAFQPIVKNRDVEITMKSGGRYRFRYADLEEILTKTRPALSANGLALIQTVHEGRLVCSLVHADGGSMSSTVDMPSARDLGDPKSFGAAITYLRRYLVTAMLGVAADDDLDEDGQEMGEATARTTSKPPVAQPQRRAPAEAPTPAAAPAAGDSTPATQGEIAYITKKIEAAGLTIAQARNKAGMDVADTLEGLDKAGFGALKAVL